MRIADSPVAHDHDPVGERDGFIDVMGDEQHGCVVFAAQLANQVVHPQPGDRVQRCERLVEQHQLRLRNQGAGQCDPLRLSAGKLFGPSLFATGQIHLGQRLAGSFVCVRSMQAQRDVAENALPRQQPVTLEHDRSVGGNFDATAVGLVQPRKQAQQRALAAAGGAEEDDEFVVVDREVEMVQDGAITEPCG